MAHIAVNITFIAYEYRDNVFSRLYAWNGK